MTHPFAVRRARTSKPGLRLQARDIALLQAVYNHRFARSDHVHQLIAPQVSWRIVQTRLQKLFAQGYLRRLYLPVVLDGEHAPPVHSRQPIYQLTRRGAHLLADGSDKKVSAELRHWRAERVSPLTLLHHLVITDFLVALAQACRERADVELVNGEHEGVLWARLREYRKQHRMVPAVVPDGAFTLRYPATNEVLTFYLEVVRADVKGGNRRLLDKLKRYVGLHRQGFFRTVYGHERLRAVLFATTSEARAKNFVRLAEKLTHGRRLFWFGNYQEKSTDGRPSNIFKPERVLKSLWHTADGASWSLANISAEAQGGDP